MEPCDEEKREALPALAGHYYDGDFIYDTPISTPVIQPTEEKPASRTENIRVRLTPAEKIRLHEMAKNAGMHLGEYVRLKLGIEN